MKMLKWICWHGLDVLCEENKIEEFIEISKTIKNWLPYIVNSFIDKRFINGFNEGFMVIRILNFLDWVTINIKRDIKWWEQEKW